MGNSALGRGTAIEENKVKASAGDTPDFLDQKVDATTINVSANQLVALPAGIDHDQLLNFVGNEHIDHSGVNIATAVNTSGLAGGGNITATRNLVVDIANTTAGTVASLDEVLIADVDDSDNLKRVTAQSIADLGGGGGDLSLVSVTSGSGSNTGDIAISPSNRYLVLWYCNSGSASNVEFRVNSLTAANYSWGASQKEIGAATAETYFGTDNQGEIPLIDQAHTLDGTNGILRGHFYIDTLLNSGTLPHSIYIWGENMYRDNSNSFWSWKFSGAYQASITVANFEIDFGGTGTTHAVYLYQFANS